MISREFELSRHFPFSTNQISSYLDYRVRDIQMIALVIARVCGMVWVCVCVCVCAHSWDVWMTRVRIFRRYSSQCADDKVLMF